MADPSITAAMNRADAYALLSACFRELGEEWAGAIRSVVGAAAMLPPGFPLPEAGEEWLERVRRDHARLFVGPFRVLAPPFGSVYLEEAGKLMGDSTADALRHYAEAGFKVECPGPPDHVSLELEFMARLAAEEAEAVRDGDEARAELAKERQRRFFVEHVGKWGPGFASRVCEHARSVFYRELGAATQEFLAKERTRIAAAAPL